MTVLELIQKTTAFFEKAGVPQPRLDTELLLAHVLSLKRMDLYIQFERVLLDAELDKLRPLVKRRSQREPLQHILETVDFCGLDLTVTKQALIPRQETEVLVHEAVKCINSGQQAQVLDLGTGSGAIILSILKVRPMAQGVAVDVSPDALELAKLNAGKVGLQERVDFRLGSLFEVIRDEEKFDVIVSNPPYIPSGELEKLQAEVKHDPRRALDGGDDGLEIIRQIVSVVSKYLKEGGWLLMEIGHDQSVPVRKLLEETGLKNISVVQDLQGISRIVKAQ